MQEYTVRVDADGDKYWYQNDELHRLDGPAVECYNGDEYWYQNDELHRLDGPALEYAYGYKAWYQNGKRHRLNGPAREYADGHKEWYIEGKELTKKEFLSRTQSPRKVTMQEVVEQFGENVVITKGKR